jgi:hypothetical protein
MQRIHWWSDWLAVDAVFCEPVSAANSLLNREFTGNFTVLRPVGGDRAQENLDQSAAYNQIPYAIEQGIIFKDQGIYSTEQGFFFAPQGKRDKRQLVAWFVLARGDAILAGRCHCVDEENTVGTSA